MADDDEDDQLLLREAFRKVGPSGDLRVVNDGEELLTCLRHTVEEGGAACLPDLILLDLNMPRKDGRETLRELKADPALRSIPVVIFTTSAAADDITTSYDLGGNSYIRKPDSFAGLVEVVRMLDRYWFDTVRLPGHALDRSVA